MSIINKIKKGPFYQGYQVIAGGFFGLVFGIAILLITASVGHNLLMLTSTGQRIEKAILPFIGYLGPLVPLAGLIFAIRKKESTASDKKWKGKKQLNRVASNST